jgi:hypothetical protein
MVPVLVLAPAPGFRVAAQYLAVGADYPMMDRPETGRREGGEHPEMVANRVPDIFAADQGRPIQVKRVAAGASTVKEKGP